MQSSIVLLTFAVVLGMVYGFPSGPPVIIVRGLCEAMEPTGHGPSKATGEPPYVIAVSSSTYQANAALQVSVKSSSGSGSFEGIFVQARRLDASKGSTTEPLGVFSDLPADTQLLNCGGVKGNAWGHNDKTSKTERTVTWTAPSDDEGPIVFVATIVQGPKEIYWMDVKSSQITYDSGKLQKGKLDNNKKQRLYLKYNKP